MKNEEELMIIKTNFKIIEIEKDCNSINWEMKKSHF